MKCLFSILILIIILIISWKRDDKLFLYFSIWCLIILLDMSASRNKLGEISSKFDMVFSTFLIVVYVTYSIVAFLLRNSNKEIILIFPKKMSFSTYYKITIIISLAFIIMGIIKIGTVSPLALRNAILNRDASFHSGISMALLSSSMYYANYNGTRKQRIVIAIALLITGAISTSKIFLIVAALYIIPWYIKGFKMKIRYLALLVIAAIIGFYVYNGFTGRIVGESSNLFMNVLYTMNGYLIGGIEVFQRFLDGNAVMTAPGWYRTGTFITNVQSIFYYIYWNKTFMFFTLSCIGIGILYGLLSSNMKSLQFLKIYSMFPIFFIFFDDLFYKSILQWLCFAIAGILIFAIQDTKRINNDKQFQYDKSSLKTESTSIK